MSSEASTNTKAFEQTLEDLTDEAEMADGTLSREMVDNLYLRRSITPDDAVRLEKMLGECGITVKESETVSKTSPVNERAIIYDSAVQQLIAGAQRLSLLTPDEEAAHGEAVQKSLALQEKPSSDLSDIEKRIILNGKRSLDALVQHNIRLVTSFAFDPKYRSRHDLDDMVQMGLLGLMRAAEKYDPTLGFRFSTYAMWWIRQSIHRGIANNGKTIRLPVHMLEQVSKYKRAQRTLELNNNSTGASVRKVAESLGWSLSHAARIAQISEMRTVSFDAPIGEDGAATVGELIADKQPGPEQLAVANDIASIVQDIIKELPDERQKDIIKRRFGLEGPEETLEAIGQSYDVTRERIRQIEEKALKRLRKRIISAHLRELGENLR